MSAADQIPMVSIVIPAHRAARYLPLTLQSVAAQTWRNWEVLVLEDGRHDDTAGLVAAFAPPDGQPVRHVVQDPAGGVSRARNHLIAVATGTHLAFLDADDLWHPEHLEHALALMQQEQADWFIGGYDLIDPQGELIRAGQLPPQLETRDIPNALLKHNFIITSGVVARREAFADGRCFDPSLVVGEDLDWCIRVLRAGFRPACSPRATLRYRKHPTSVTADPVRFAEEFSRVYEKYLDDPAVDPAIAMGGFRELIHNTLRMTWRHQPARARAAARRLLQHRPLDARAWLYRLLASVR